MIGPRHATLLCSPAAIPLIAACSRNQPDKNESVVTDTAFGTMQHRGGMAMGVDQYTSTSFYGL